MVGDVLVLLGLLGTGGRGLLAVLKLAVADELERLEVEGRELEHGGGGGGEGLVVDDHVAVVELPVAEGRGLVRGLGDGDLDMSGLVAVAVLEDVLGDDELDLAGFVLVLAGEGEDEAHLCGEHVGAVSLGLEREARGVVVLDVVRGDPAGDDLLDALVVAGDRLLIVGLRLDLGLDDGLDGALGGLTEKCGVGGLVQLLGGDEVGVVGSEVGGVDDVGRGGRVG